MIRAFLLLVTSAALAACALDIADPEVRLEGLPEGLEVGLMVDPAEVNPHEPFTTQLKVTNTTPDTIRIVTAHGCLVTLNVVRNEKRIPFEGSAFGCTASITTHTFAPGETHSMDWKMRAELYAQYTGEVEGAPAPKGTYRVRAEFDTYSETAPQRKPTVEAELLVR